MIIPNIYAGNYKRLMIIPIILIVISLLFIPQIKLGIDFKGGTIITLYSDEQINTEDLMQELINADMPVYSIRQVQTTLGNVIEIELETSERISRSEGLRSEFSTHIEEVSRLEAFVSQTEGKNQTIINMYNEERAIVNEIANELFLISGYAEKTAESIETANELREVFTHEYLMVHENYENTLDDILKRRVHYTSITVDIVSPALSTKFIERAFYVTIISIIFAVILSFIVFKNLIISVLVMTGAVGDLIICLGAMGLFQIPLSLPSFAALLMMLGFSLDTDMLLAIKIFKRQNDTPRERAFDAMKTGATISLTDFIAFFSLLVLAILTNISTYYEIAAVAVIGLLGDVIATWLFNAVILLSYLERGKVRT